MKGISGVKCIIFDCDGTLVESEILCCQAHVNIYGELGHSYSRDDIASRFAGTNLNLILATIKAETGISLPNDELEQRFRAECSRLFKLHLEAVDGVPELLSHLSKQAVSICVASNAPQTKMREVLGATGLDHYFQERLFSCYDINRWKPEPDILFHSAEQMGYALDECIFVDDSHSGAMAGVNAGVRTFHYVPHDVTTAIEHPLVTPISSMSDLLGHLEIQVNNRV